MDTEIKKTPGYIPPRTHCITMRYEASFCASNDVNQNSFQDLEEETYNP